jgi:hypothetical protein
LSEHTRQIRVLMIDHHPTLLPLHTHTHTHTHTHAHTRAGGVVLSGWLALRSEYPGAMTEAGKAIPFFHGHGDADSIVNFKWGKGRWVCGWGGKRDGRRERLLCLFTDTVPKSLNQMPISHLRATATYWPANSRLSLPTSTHAPPASPHACVRAPTRAALTPSRPWVSTTTSRSTAGSSTARCPRRSSTCVPWGSVVWVGGWGGHDEPLPHSTACAGLHESGPAALVSISMRAYPQ